MMLGEFNELVMWSASHVPGTVILTAMSRIQPAENPLRQPSQLLSVLLGLAARASPRSWLEG